MFYKLVLSYLRLKTCSLAERLFISLYIKFSKVIIFSDSQGTDSIIQGELQTLCLPQFYVYDSFLGFKNKSPKFLDNKGHKQFSTGDLINVGE